MNPSQPQRRRPLSPRGIFCIALALSLSWGAIAAPLAAESAKERVAQGQALFAEKGCAHCHGDAGFGGSDTGPDLSHVRQQLKPEQMTTQIHDGGKNMPPFGDDLSGDQIAALVQYLRSKRTPPKKASASPATPSVDAHPDPE